jgi:hypothetical protein
MPECDNYADICDECGKEAELLAFFEFKLCGNCWEEANKTLAINARDEYKEDIL